MAIAVATGRIEIRRTQTDQSTALVHQIQNWRLGVSSQAVLSEVLPHSSAPDRRESSDDITIQPSSTGQLKTNEPIAVRQLVFSPDGQRLMAIANDFTIRLWDVQTGEMLHALRGHEATVQQAQFSSNGESIVSASWDRTVRIWSTTTGETLRTIHHPDAVNSARFSPNHQYIITAGWDGIARVFKANTGEQKFLLARHQQAVLDAEFSPDGQRAVTAGADGTAYLWEMQTGTAEAELRLPQTNEPLSLLQASFSPDGQYVATLSKDGRVHLWAATWEMLLKLSRDRSLRQLTPDECSRYLKLAPNECPMLPLGEG
jgi:WD40 repeat protein